MEKKEKDHNDNNRRNFLRTVLAAGAGIGLISVISGNAKAEVDGEKIKLLTADGKLIEVDKSKIRGEVTPERASDREVLAWMNEHRKKS